MVRADSRLLIFLGIVLAASINAFLIGLTFALYQAGDLAERSLAGLVMTPTAWLVILFVGFGIDHSRRFYAGNLVVALLAGVALLMRTAG